VACLSAFDGDLGRVLDEAAVVAVDVPMGLPSIVVHGGRDCDREARRLLAGKRKSSVFSPPSKAALWEATFNAAQNANRRSTKKGLREIGLSQQAFALFDKIRDAKIALVLSDWLRSRAIEIHPEICFTKMPGSAPLGSKKTRAGAAERRSRLRGEGFLDLCAFENAAKELGAKTDDALDACAAAWTAWRYATGEKHCLPADPDGPDHHMRIWY
jgi:predicted RNase H-like nuclease